MNTHKIAVKLFATAGSELTSHELVPVFHRWIQTHAIPDHLLIDVADYAHVVGGPGTVLVSSEANIYLDRGGEGLGLLYSRKLASPGDFPQQVRYAVEQAVRAARLLEQDAVLAGRLQFNVSRILIRLNDRLLAPNNAQTLAMVKPVIESLARELFEVAVELTPAASASSLFELTAKASTSVSLEQLLSRLESVTA